MYRKSFFLWVKKISAIESRREEEGIWEICTRCNKILNTSSLALLLAHSVTRNRWSMRVVRCVARGVSHVYNEGRKKYFVRIRFEKLTTRELLSIYRFVVYLLPRSAKLFLFRGLSKISRTTYKSGKKITVFSSYPFMYVNNLIKKTLYPVIIVSSAPCRLRPVTTKRVLLLLLAQWISDCRTDE